LKAGGDLSIASESSFSINSTTFSDSGYYYCVVSNSAGTVISDTIRLIVSSKNPDIKPNLRARAISTENVRLHGMQLLLYQMTKIRIVCSDTDIDTGVLTLKDNYRLIAIGSKDTFSVISGLKPATRYCFAIQAGNETAGL
jgi:hypothetical protein